MVSGEDYGFGFGIVGGAAWVLASILVAVFALEAPFAVFGMTVTDEMFAATMGAAKGGSKHRLILPHQTNLSHYQLKIVVFGRNDDGLYYLTEMGQKMVEDWIAGTSIPGDAGGAEAK